MTHATLIIGSAEDIRYLLCGPPQYDEHCKGYRWHLYVRDDAERIENVRREFNLMMQERRERAEALRAEADRLEAAE